MSILANLLSRKKPDSPQESKDIPPTLAKAHATALRKPATKKRYFILAVISLTLVAVGFAVSSPKFMRLLLPKPVRYPIPPVPSPATTVREQPAPTSVPTETSEQSMPTFVTKPVPLATGIKKTRTVAAKHRHAKTRLSAVVPSAKAGLHKEEPLKSVQKASQVDPTVMGAFLYAARSAEYAGDWRSALNNYRKALEIDPNNYKIINNSAAAFNNLGMFDDGSHEAGRALAIKQDYVPAMINHAIASSSMGRNQEALVLFSKARTIDPSNKNLAINLGILEERIGMLGRARATYRTLADMGSPEALMGLGRIGERTGNKGEAIDSYRRILTLHTASPAIKREAKEKLAHLEE